MALALALGLIAELRFGEVRNVGGTAAALVHHVENPKDSRSNLSVGEIAVVLKVNIKELCGRKFKIGF